MSTGTLDEAAGRERLSALVDGELDGGGVDAACGAWRADAELRRTWHAWHAIGDALRSDDLVCNANADRSFYAAVSARLATEAVVLAPMRHQAVGRSAASMSLRSRWAVGSAVAAGVFLVAGTFVLVRPGSSPGPERLALVEGTAASSPVVVAGGDVPAPQVATIADQKVIRDAQLDRYLVAHKQFAGSSALGVPSAFLRSATVDSASR